MPPSAVAVADLFRVLLKAVAARHDVAAKLIATTDDLDKIALDDEAEVAALHGWRRELFGEDALAIKAGRLAIAVENGKIVTLPLPAAAMNDAEVKLDKAPHKSTVKSWETSTEGMKS